MTTAAYQREYRIKNKVRIAGYSKKYRTKNPDKIKSRRQRYYAQSREKILKDNAAYLVQHPNYNKNRLLKVKYGLTIETFEKMRTDQNYKCAICTKMRTLVVDHNHATNTVRALLCNRCNMGLGLLDESIETLQATIKYLMLHNLKEKQNGTDN